MTLVADIRRVMLEKGVAQAELARTLGMSPSQLSAILRDENYNFTVRMLRRFAAALDTDLSITIGDEDRGGVEIPTIGGSDFASGGIIYPITGTTITRPGEKIVYTSGDAISFTLTDEGATWVEDLLGSDPSDD